MENLPEGLGEKIDSLHTRISRCEERLEQLNNDLSLQITSLNAAVEKALSSLLPKVESLITQDRVVSEASSYKPVHDTGKASANSTSTSETSPISNRKGTSVTEAAAAGDAVVLRRILANGGNANIRDSDGVPALHLAAARGHLQAVRALLEAGARVNMEGPMLRKALHEAAANGHVDVVRSLLEAGSDAEGKDLQGNTPLMLAIKIRQWQVARLLVEKGADPNTTISEGKTALIAAAAEGELETVAVMLRYKKPDDVRKALSYAKNVSVVFAFEDALHGVIRNEGGNAMLLASEHGRLESMVALLKVGIDIEYKDGLEQTALIWASSIGHVDCVKALVRRGAFLDAVTFLGNTALHLAAAREREDVVRVLLDAGADASITTNGGMTPLDLASSTAIKDIFMKHPKCTA